MDERQAEAGVEGLSDADRNRSDRICLVTRLASIPAIRFLQVIVVPLVRVRYRVAVIISDAWLNG